MKKVVAFTAERLREQKEHAAKGGAHVGRGSRELCSPFANGGKDVERGRVIVGASAGCREGGGVGCEGPGQGVRCQLLLFIRAVAGVVPVPPYRKGESMRWRSRTQDVGKGGHRERERERERDQSQRARERERRRERREERGEEREREMREMRER